MARESKGVMRNAYKILVDRPEGKRLLGKECIQGRLMLIIATCFLIYSYDSHRLRYLGNEIDSVGRGKLVIEYQITIKSVRPVKQVSIKSIFRIGTSSARTVTFVRTRPIFV
jgi:hypothetical protein